MERRKLAKNKTSSISPVRLAKLDALGFNWGKEKGQASWDEKYVSTSLCFLVLDHLLHLHLASFSRRMRYAPSSER
jgi:hypothetical protein